MKFNIPENLAPTPDRNKAIETIKRSGFESQEAQISFQKYVDRLYHESEKDKDADRDIKMNTELAKLYHDVGQVKVAINLLVDSETGILYEAKRSGFTDRYYEICDLADEWRDE